MANEFVGLTRLGRNARVIAGRARAGVSVGGFPRISLNNRGFMAKNGELARHVGEINPDSGTQCMRAIILDVAPYEGTAKVYYENPFDEENSGPPTCKSDNGVRPDGGVNRQAESCATCIMNVWGSSKVGSGKGKACSDQKWLAMVVPLVDLSTVFRFVVPPASTGRFATYVETVANTTIDGAPADMAELVTLITWDPDVQGRLLFDAESTVDHLTPIENVAALINDGQVQRVLSSAPAEVATALQTHEAPKALEAPTAAARSSQAATAKPPAFTKSAERVREEAQAAALAAQTKVEAEAAARLVANKATKPESGLVRKAGPLSGKPSAEDVPTPTNFGMKQATAPSEALSAALASLDLDEGQ